MDIDNLTIKDAREIARIFGQSRSATHSLPIGKAVLIRTVTMNYTGRIASVTESDLVLEDAAWIADTGRFSTALKDGFPANAEIEPFFSPVIVSRSVLVDCCEWPHPLPRAQK